VERVTAFRNWAANEAGIDADGTLQQCFCSTRRCAALCSGVPVKITD
jgi:hypothetical protein